VRPACRALRNRAPRLDVLDPANTGCCGSAAAIGGDGEQNAVGRCRRRRDSSARIEAVRSTHLAGRHSVAVARRSRAADPQHPVLGGIEDIEDVVRDFEARAKRSHAS